MALESLVVPAADAAQAAGKLILNLRDLWASANMEEQRKLLLTMLDAVYVEVRQTRSIVAVKPKPPFRPIFQVTATKEGSGIRIENEPYMGSPVFLVETGEALSLSETTFDWLGDLRWLGEHEIPGELAVVSACGFESPWAGLSEQFSNSHLGRRQRSRPCSNFCFPRTQEGG